ncbi:hypothetical protein CORC01_05476 [Colletotrichum orchidophilum]|uniref:Uncharacterized protein n=1 Tax=Colletotrichum orchidophilum TaxID=1209926 RepID=A0A1G4BCX7_9PEZI|nr:uncharacterized protein CORC01_05476 [Colletotrichum orchidophilum]OHE99195.1 hypothetical protein CORC01_05476 [Colletotrichum orchidophilum]
MDVHQQPSYWPVSAIWRNADARTAYDSSKTLLKNPFRRLSEAEDDATNVQCVEKYHSYQLSCYVQPSVVRLIDNESAPTTASPCEEKTSSGLWWRGTRLCATSLLSSAKETYRAMGSTATRRLDQVREDVCMWWPPTRRLRLWLRRLLIAWATAIMSTILACHVMAQNPPVYVLVHACQSWSVYQSR